MIFIIYQDFKNTISVSEVLNYVLEWLDFLPFIGIWGFGLHVPRPGTWNIVLDPSKTSNASFRYVEK